MNSNKKVLFNFLGFTAFILIAYFFSPLVLPFLIGGVIQQGILGKFSGKVGPVVGGDWKGIGYMRSYVIPANPQSTGQTTQRTRFTIIQEYARQVLSTLIQPYWNQYQSGQSGYNAIMSDWMLNASAGNLLVAACKAAKGTLSSQALDGAVYTTGTGALYITWTLALVGNQLSTDTVKILVFDKSSGLLYFDDNAATRNDGEVSITITTGLTATNLEVFVFFAQGSGSSMIVSDSVHQTATAV